MTGGIVSRRFPYLPIRLEIRLEEHDLEALLDTGFDGDVVVPRALVASRFPPDGHIRWTLADGSGLLAPYYVGTVRVGQLPPISAVVTVLGDEPLVGVGVARHFAVTLDHGRQVIIAP